MTGARPRVEPPASDSRKHLHPRRYSITSKYEHDELMPVLDVMHGPNNKDPMRRSSSDSEESFKRSGMVKEKDFEFDVPMCTSPMCSTPAPFASEDSMRGPLVPAPRGPHNRTRRYAVELYNSDLPPPYDRA